MLSVDTEIADQVEKLSIAQKAALVVVCAIPSLSPSHELNEILTLLKKSHRNLFSGSTLTPLGARWAYEANRQLLPVYKRQLDPFSVDLDEEELDEIAFSRDVFRSSHNREEIPELEAEEMQSNGYAFQDQLLDQASRFQEMMINKRGVCSERFQPTHANNGKQRKRIITNADSGGSLSDLSFRLPSKINLEPCPEPLPSFIKDQIIANPEYSQNLEAIISSLALTIKISELPSETTQTFQKLLGDPQLATAKSVIAQNTIGLVIKIRKEDSTLSECQIMLDTDGKILNMYGLEEYQAGSPKSEW